MKSSMRTRLCLIFSALLFFIILCICIINVFLLPEYYQDTKISQMKKVYSQAVNLCRNVDWQQIDADVQDEIYDRLDILSSNSNVDIFIVRIEVYSQSGDIATLNYMYPTENTERLQEVTKEQLGKYVKATYFGEILDDNCQVLSQSENCEVYKVYDDRVQSNYIELTGLLPDNCWLYLRTNYQSIQDSTAVSNRFMLYVGIVAMFFGIILMVIVSTQYTKPIMRLVKHAENMRKLNFSSRYEDDRRDEIGILGDSMNSLADKLEETISELKTANNELQLDLQRRSEQEEMRREFLANVSHELKTPIALIQGYAEGLLENVNDDAESREFYCEVIVDEADRMNKMVKKLLSLNQLEFGNGQIHMEHFNLQDVLKSVINSTEILFRQKEAELLFTAQEEPVMVWADEYMIEEVVTNYVSNALNHVQYEKKVEIKEEMRDGIVRVSVFNTGNPIPEDELSKIWNKFYKVDKARTREYGGNGIGLSIVRAVMEAHNQKYGVRNYNNGVEFWFELDTKNTIDMKSVD